MIDCVYCNKPFKNESSLEEHLLTCNIDLKKGVYTQFRDKTINIETEDEDELSDEAKKIKDIILEERIKKTDPEIWKRIMKKTRQSRDDVKTEMKKKSLEIESRKFLECKFCHKKFTRTYNLNRHLLTTCVDKESQVKTKKETQINKIDKDNILEIRRLKQQIKTLKEDDITKNKIIENLLFYTDKIDSHIDPTIENNNLIISKICSSLFYATSTDKKKEELFKTKWNKFIKNQIETELSNLEEVNRLDLFHKYERAFHQLIIAINRLKNLNKNFYL